MFDPDKVERFDCDRWKSMVGQGDNWVHSSDYDALLNRLKEQEALFMRMSNIADEYKAERDGWKKELDQLKHERDILSTVANMAFRSARKGKEEIKGE